MNKLSWINMFDFDSIKKEFLNVNTCCEGNSLDFFMIINGDMYLKYATLSLLTLFKHTDIYNYRLSLLYDESLVEDNEDLFDRFSKLNINLIPINSNNVKIIEGSNWLPKYDYISRNKFKNNVVIIDADTFVLNKFSFSRLESLPKDCLIFAKESAAENNNPVPPLLDRYNSVRKKDNSITFVDFLKKIYSFFEPHTDISFNQFRRNIFETPTVKWPNCGMGIIPLSVMSDCRFSSWCDYERDEIGTLSDEFVYFFYSMFFDVPIVFLDEYDFNFTSTPFCGVNKNCEFFHLFGKRGFNIFQLALESLIKINNNRIFVSEEDDNKLHSNFDYKKESLICVGEKDVITFCERDDLFFISVDESGKTILKCDIKLNDKGYYLRIETYDNRITVIPLFKDIPHLFIVEYTPSYLNSDINGFYLNIFNPCGEFYFNGFVGLSIG